jgi:lysosomal Pro-X carboxypeptidase
LAVPSLETRTLQVPIDHFTFDSRAATFGLRYLISDENCAHHQVKAKTACPILFYAGGEDGIAAFANATGFLWQLSEDLGATLVYAEHRY